MSKTDDPWLGLERPESKDAVNVRRVNARAKWDLFWGLDADGKCLLLLHHSHEVTPTQRLPKPKGLEMLVRPVEDDRRASLVLRLLDKEAREIFAELCRDIATSVFSAETESGAVTSAIARTWRWHRLLRGGGAGLLSPEEQKGLIGELIVLERYLLKHASADQAVRAWRGPLGAPQDFVLGGVAIESKAKSTRTADEVLINSEFQLETGALQSLFLHLSTLDAADPGTDGSFTVTDVVNRVRQQIEYLNADSINRFDGLLAAAGYDQKHDYADQFWVGGERGVYHVRSGFPCLTPASIGDAVSRVAYVVSLSNCGTFLVTPASLDKALGVAGQ